MTPVERSQLVLRLQNLANEILHLPEAYPNDSKDMTARTAANMVLFVAKRLENEYRPWEQHGQSEAEYWKSRYIEREPVIEAARAVGKQGCIAAGHALGGEYAERFSDLYEALDALED